MNSSNSLHFCSQGEAIFVGFFLGFFVGSFFLGFCVGGFFLGFCVGDSFLGLFVGAFALGVFNGAGLGFVVGTVGLLLVFFVGNEFLLDVAEKYLLAPLSKSFESLRELQSDREESHDQSVHHEGPVPV